MRLLITTDTVGGVWSFTRDLSTELFHRGHAVALVSFGRSPSQDQQRWVAATQAAHGENFTFAAADTPLEWEQNNAESFSAGDQHLHLVAGTFAPEILISNQFCFGASTLPNPRIVVAHSDVLSWAKAVKPSALEPTPWLNQYTSLVQRGLLQADAVVAPSQAMRDALKPNFFFSRQILVIPNGATLFPADPTLRKLQAVTAGRLWDEAKGLQLLLDMQLPLPVLVAGDTTHDGSDAAELPSNPNLTLLGPLAAEALHQLFRESAIYLCTSLYEPFGLAPLEAALSGCAVVARDLPSLREVWGDYALFFRDAAELNQLLNVLTSNPATLAEAQQRSRQRAGLYSTARMADSYLALCEQLLQHKAGPHAA